MKLRDKLVQSMAEDGAIEQDEIEVYRFGVQLLSETVISFAIFLIIAALFGSIVEFVIFTGAFALLRQYAGGYHADRFISCLLISCCVITLFCIAIRLPYTAVYFIGALSVISLIIIILLAPVDSKHKRITEADRTKYRKKLIIILIVETALSGIIMLYSVHLSICILFSWIILSCLLIVGKIKNRHMHLENVIV